MNRVEYISFLHKQNLNGRETEDELFEAGINAGIEETEELINEKLTNIEMLLNELHNDMAKSIIEMKTYKPLSNDLLTIKDKIRLLKDSRSN
jgi:hypothetical protein